MSLNVTSSQIEELALKGCFVAVHVRRPSLRTQIRWADLGLDIDETVVSAPSARPPSANYNVFSRIEQRLRTRLDASTAGNAGGLRFMKWSVYERFAVDADALCADYMAAVEPFLATYDADVEAALETWRSTSRTIYLSLTAPPVDEDTFVARIEEHLRRAWPSAEALRSKFDASIDVLNFTLPTAETMRATPEMIRAARAQASETLTTFFAEAQNELRESLVEAVRRVHAVLTTRETVTDRTVLPLREAVSRFRELSIVGDAAFARHLDAIERALEGDAERLRSDTSAWATARDTLASVVEQAEEVIAQDKRPIRKIRIEDISTPRAA